MKVKKKLPNSVYETLDMISEQIDSDLYVDSNINPDIINQASCLFETIDPKYHSHPYVLEVSAALDCIKSDYSSALRKLWRLYEIDPSNYENRLSFVQVLIRLSFIALAASEAKKLLNKGLEVNLESNLLEIIEASQSYLDGFEVPGINPELKNTYLVKFDLARMLAMLGDLEASKKENLELFRIYSKFPPVLNNLSEGYFYAGDLENALFYADKCLECSLGNSYALCAKVRCELLLHGEPSAGSVDAICRAPFEFNFFKQLEALCLIGEFGRVLDFYKQHKILYQDLGDYKDQIYVYLAFAAYKLSKFELQKQYLKSAYEADPFSLGALQYLESEKPDLERSSGYIYKIQSIISLSFIEKIQNKKTDQILALPWINNLIKFVLNFADQDAVSVVFLLFSKKKHDTDLLKAFENFISGTRLSDLFRMRLERSFFELTKTTLREQLQFNSGRTPDQFKELIIHNEPTEDPNITNEEREATFLMHSGKFKKAIKMLQQVIKNQPDRPTPLYNYAVCLHQLDSEDEARTILNTLTAKFPDYFFGQAKKADFLVQEEKFTEAEAIITKLWKLDKLHVAQFRQLVITSFYCDLAQARFKQALNHLEHWEHVLPDEKKIIEGLRGLLLQAERPSRD